MRILFVTTGYDQQAGGVQTQLRSTANELARRHRVEVATSDPVRRSYTDGNVQVHSIALSVIDLIRSTPRRVIPKRFRRQAGSKYYWPAYISKLRSLVRGKHLVHALTTGSLSWAAERAARAEGVPFLITPYIHSGEEGGKIVDAAFSAAALCKRADIVFALMETDKQMLIELGIPSERVRLQGVAPLLPETSDAAGFRGRHQLDDKPIVLFVGRMVEYKGVLALLNAAPRVWVKIPDAHFIFAGPADDRARAWFAERADERIRYLGLVDEQEKGDALAACDVFCMPSTAEILPGVYLEAWSYGKAVIGGVARGLHELIEGNSAGLVVEQNPEALAERLVELLLDEPRRRGMGQRGRGLVKERFSLAGLSRNLERAYEEVCPPASGDKTRPPGRPTSRQVIRAVRPMRPPTEATSCEALVAWKPWHREFACPPTRPLKAQKQRDTCSCLTGSFSSLAVQASSGGRW